MPSDTGLITGKIDALNVKINTVHEAIYAHELHINHLIGSMSTIHGILIQIGQDLKTLKTVIDAKT